MVHVDGYAESRMVNHTGYTAHSDKLDDFARYQLALTLSLMVLQCRINPAIVFLVSLCELNKEINLRNFIQEAQ